MCMVAEPYSVSYDWTQIMCGASGTVALLLLSQKSDVFVTSVAV